MIIFLDNIRIVLLYQVYWLGLLFGGLVVGFFYDNVFVMNVLFLKVWGFLLLSQYDNEKFLVSKFKIWVIVEEEDEEDRDLFSSLFDFQRDEYVQKFFEFLQ